MMATEDRIGRLETKLDGIDGRIGRIEGSQEQMSKRLDDSHKRLDDMHKLLIVLLAIVCGQFLTAMVSLVLQLVK